MSGLKTMKWDDTAWSALKDAITPMPPLVRKKALLKIIQASEENARDRTSQVVEGEDLVKAAKEKVPEGVQKICLQSLAEHGIVDES